MTELDVHPTKACLADLAKDESTSTDTSVSSSSVPSETPLTIRPASAGADELINRYDVDLTTTPHNETTPNIEALNPPRTSSPPTPLYNAYTQHKYSPVRSQRRLSGIGISLSLEDLRNAINQEFPLLMHHHEEKKQEVDVVEDDDSDDLDPDEKLALQAQRIRSEIRQSEMLELAVEAERAAEAGLESFMGRASTFGDDMAVMDANTLKHPAALKRNSTYSEGFLRQRQMPRLRPKRKIRVLALRAVDEVIPPLGEIHSHLRTHLARNGVDEETLVFQENDIVDTERGTSNAFFKNLHNWVSQSSNLSTPPRFMSERFSERLSERDASNRLAAIPSELAIQQTPNSLVSQDEKKCDEDSDDDGNDSTDSSIVGDTLAGHFVASTGNPRFRPMSSEIKIPQGLEWSMVQIGAPATSVRNTMSIFDAISPPHLGSGSKSASSFEEGESSKGFEGVVTTAPLQTPDPMTPLVLFDATDDGEIDADHQPNHDPHIPQNDMMTPDIVGRKTPDMDFQTPVRLRDIRDKDSSDGSSTGLAIRNDNNHRRGFPSFSRTLQPRKSDVPLLPRPQNGASYVAPTFISTQPDNEPSSNSLPDFLDDTKLLYQPLVELNDDDNNRFTESSVEQQASTFVDEQRSAMESVTFDNLAGKQVPREMPNLNESLEGNDRQAIDAKKETTPITQNEDAEITVIVNRVEQREDCSYQGIYKDPSTEYSLVLVSTPDDSLLDVELERDSEERVQPSPSATTESGNRTDEEGSHQLLSAVDLRQNPVAPATPPMRSGCECLVPLSRSDYDPKLMVDALEKEEAALEIRRVASCPSLVDIMDTEPHSPLSPKRGLNRVPSHKTEKTVWHSLGLEERIPSSTNRRTRRSDSLQAAVDTMMAKLSPTTCGSPKYPYISHADNNDFLNNYLYCSKPMDQWSLLDATTSFDETTQSASLQCVNFIFGSTCDGFTSLVTSLLPKRRNPDHRDVFTLNKDAYTEVDPDSWFNVAAERFDGALERLVGRAREHRNRFQAPSLKKKPPSVRRIASPPEDDEPTDDDNIALDREKAPDEAMLERAPEPSLSDPQFRIIYGMSRERFQELNTVAQRFKDRFSPDRPEEESSSGVKRELFSPEHPEEEPSSNVQRDLITSLSALTA